MKKTIVIAHYNEDLEWCLNLKNDFDIQIYSKTDKNYNFIDNNKSQEVPMYLKYIIDNYYNLPDKILFLHGHNMSYHQDFPSEYIIKNVNWDINDYFSVNRRNSYQELSNNFELSENAFNNWIKNNWYIFQNKLPFPKNGLFFYPNAQFVVSRENIKQYSKDFWVNLYKWATTTNINNVITSRIFEYCWHYIFTRNTNEKIINNIFIEKKFKKLSHSLINIIMVNNKIYINSCVNIDKCLIQIKDLKTKEKIYECVISIDNINTYWIKIPQQKKDLYGIITTLQKNSIIIYEEYIKF